jgi:alcohol dehydrogenase class IV
MMQNFTYQAAPMRVIFGAGTLSQLMSEVARLGISRALLLATPNQVQQASMVAELLGDRAAGSFTQAEMHTPVSVTDRAMAYATELKVDGVVAIGGGSTTGLGKAIALRTDLPQIVVPTSYAGSEMTSILGETRDGLKTTQSSPKILPETVIYDVDLTMTMPQSLSAASGLNAIAHAVEALYARDRNPIISLMAQEGIRSLAQALPKIKSDAKDVEARTEALYGAWLCGSCLGAVGMALHHKLCHTLGGAFNLPHAETHAIILPHAVAYNASADPQAMSQIARALGANDAAVGLFELAGAIGVRRSLRDVGMREEDIDHASDLAVTSPYWNPRPVERDAVRGLIARAWAGAAPVDDVRGFDG